MRGFPAVISSLAATGTGDKAVAAMSVHGSSRALVTAALTVIFLLSRGGGSDVQRQLMNVGACTAVAAAMRNFHAHASVQ